MDETTIKTYNQKAQEYTDETEEVWQRFPSTFPSEFIQLAKDKVLDIGSGSGRDAKIFTSFGLDVTCLDASQSMVEISKAKGFHSLVGNFLELPFEEKAFDGVWAYTSLLHIHKKDIEKAFMEIKRVLKNGGILGLGLIEGEGEENRKSMGEEFPRLFTYYKREEIEEIAGKLGFKKVFFEKHTVKSKVYLHFLFENL